MPLRGKGIRPVAVSPVRRFAHSPHRRGGVGRSELVRYLGLGPQNIVQRHDTDRRTILLSHQYEEISGFSDHLIYRFFYRGIRRNDAGWLRGHGLFDFMPRKSGINIRLQGARGTLAATQPATFVQGFLANLDATQKRVAGEVTVKKLIPEPPKSASAF